MKKDATPNNASGSAGDWMIKYPRFMELYEDICDCRKESKLLRQPQCMALEGLTGTGKTTLALNYASRFPRYEEDYKTIVPVFYMGMPSPATMKGTGSKMLDTLGDPGAYSGTQARLDARLIKLLTSCRVELVILDDIHHLIDTESNRVLARVANWLKVLIKETSIPFLILGIEGQIDRILQADNTGELSRLFAAREKLEPFGWNYDAPGTVEDFNKIIISIENIAQILIVTDLDRVELAWRMHYATNGVVANLINLMHTSKVFAQRQGLHHITRQILSQAFVKRLSKHLTKKLNPFDDAHGTRFTPPLLPSV